MDEKRRTPRRDVEEWGHVSFAGASLACVVRNISQDGAALEVENAAYIPPRFRLVLPQDDIVRDCRLVWIQRNRIGVAFDS